MFTTFGTNVVNITDHNGERNNQYQPVIKEVCYYNIAGYLIVTPSTYHGPTKYRLLSLLSVISKVFESVLTASSFS